MSLNALQHWPQKPFAGAREAATIEVYSPEPQRFHLLDPSGEPCPAAINRAALARVCAGTRNHLAERLELATCVLTAEADYQRRRFRKNPLEVEITDLEDAWYQACAIHDVREQGRLWALLTEKRAELAAGGRGPANVMQAQMAALAGLFSGRAA